MTEEKEGAEMFEGYELIRENVDTLIRECEMKIADLDPKDEYEGRVRMIMKSMCRSELVHRCAVLILEDLPEEDLRELFGDEVYERAERLFADTSRAWDSRHKLYS